MRDAVVELRDAAMPVAHVFAEANVGDYDERGQLRFQPPDGALGDSVFRVSLRRVLIFLRGNAEQQHRANARCVGRPCLEDEFVDIELENAGHTRNSDTPGDLIGDEERQN